MRAVTEIERWCAEWDALIERADSLGAAIDASLTKLRAMQDRSIQLAYGIQPATQVAIADPQTGDQCPVCGRAVAPGVIH